MHAHWKNPEWRYVNAEQTKKPGYLADRFKQIQEEQKRKEDLARAQNNRQTN